MVAYVILKYISIIIFQRKYSLNVFYNYFSEKIMFDIMFTILLLFFRENNVWYYVYYFIIIIFQRK